MNTGTSNAANPRSTCDIVASHALQQDLHSALLSLPDSPSCNYTFSPFNSMHRKYISVAAQVGTKFSGICCVRTLSAKRSTAHSDEERHFVYALAFHINLLRRKLLSWRITGLIEVNLCCVTFSFVSPHKSLHKKHTCCIVILPVATILYIVSLLDPASGIQ